MHGIKSFPVDPVQIAKREGVSVHNALFSDSDLSGLIAKRGSETSILVNKNDAPFRKRFTIAHELGHHFLHLQEDGEFVDSTVDLFREPTTPGGRRVHIEDSISVEIWYRSGLNPDSTTTHLDRSGRTLRQHEWQHVAIARFWWDDLRRAVENVPGRYCRRRCAELASAAANHISNITFSSMEIESATLDIKEHWNPRQEFYSWRERAINRVRDERVNLGRVTEEYQSLGCYKLN